MSVLPLLSGDHASEQAKSWFQRARQSEKNRGRGRATDGMRPARLPCPADASTPLPRRDEGLSLSIYLCVCV